MRIPSRPRSPRFALLGAVVIATVVGCVGGDPGPPLSATPVTTATPAPATQSPATPAPTVVPPSPTASLPPDGERTPPALALEPVASGLDGPLDLAVRPADPDALYIAEQVGRVRVLRDGVVVERPVLDIAGAVTAGGERGLLGLTFHPDRDDPRLFVYYTALDGDQVLSSFRVDPAEPDRAIRDSEQVLLKMDDPFGNHNGGGLAFGPDGMLYVATGDGGGGGDPLGSGQSLATLLGKILRIDVDGASPEGVGYRVPDDNPFVSTADARPEIWHTGLRNPWRIRFDRATGDLWIGDVGQGSWEEIDRAPAGVGGLDFGWNVMEGFHCYGGGDVEDCAEPRFTLPIAEYGHDEGCSVTGGTVYRGGAQPALEGWYVFADYCSGRMWVLDAPAAADGDRQDPVVAVDTGRRLSAIAEDAAGELYATDLSTGEILRIVIAD